MLGSFIFRVEVKMLAVGSSKAMPIYQTRRRHISEDLKSWEEAYFCVSMWCTRTFIGWDLLLQLLHESFLQYVFYLLFLELANGRVVSCDVDTRRRHGSSSWCQSRLADATNGVNKEIFLLIRRCVCNHVRHWLLESQALHSLTCDVTQRRCGKRKQSVCFITCYLTSCLSFSICEKYTYSLETWHILSSTKIV
jgi:hypothetical protein